MSSCWLEAESGRGARGKSIICRMISAPATRNRRWRWLVLFPLSRAKTPYLPTYCGRQPPGSVPHLPTYSQAAALRTKRKIPVEPSVNRLPAPAARRLVPRCALGARRSRARQSMAYWALEALDGSKTALSSLDRVEGTSYPSALRCESSREMRSLQQPTASGRCIGAGSQPGAGVEPLEVPDSDVQTGWPGRAARG